MMENNTLKRKPIRFRLRRLALLIALATIAIMGVTGLLMMNRIRYVSRKALEERMVSDYQDIVKNRSELTNEWLKKYTKHAFFVADFAHNLLIHPDWYEPHPVYPPQARNGGKYVMQRTLVDKTITFESIKEKVELFGNLEYLMDTIMRSEEGSIVVIYVATPDGFLVGYDSNSDLAVPKPGDTEDYFDFRNRPWYNVPRESGLPYYSDVYEDAFGRGYSVTCSVPFYDANGEFGGVAAIDIIMNEFYSEAVEQIPGELSYSFLIDGKGSLLMPEGEVSSLYAFKDLNYGEIAKILNQDHCTLMTDEGIYYVSDTIRENGWKYCIRIPEAKILEPIADVNKTIVSFTITFAAIVLTSIIILFFVSKIVSDKITKPIIALDEDVSKISEGDLNHEARVMSNDEVGDLAVKFNEMTGALKRQVEQARGLAQKQERYDAEMDAARRLQEGMMPNRFPAFPGRREFDIYASMKAAREVGGDFYDFVLLDDDHLAFFIGDVGGKGIPAALFMISTKTMLRNRLALPGTPAEILSDVNEELCRNNKEGLFVTVWLGVLTLSSGRLVMANAGHEYPEIKVGGEGYKLYKTASWPPVGSMTGITFENEEVDLMPGDGVYLYTDGVTDMHSAESAERFGSERLTLSLNLDGGWTSERLIRGVSERLEEFMGDAEIDDDITQMCVTYFGVRGV
ncbi:MAG: SpoIIE family protein phosphatase [Lachnospiraceae bacterium]|nr:SpoIIE family protein phosphatase [Lachnospiraceae bacterium]